MTPTDFQFLVKFLTSSSEVQKFRNSELLHPTDCLIFFLKKALIRHFLNDISGLNKKITSELQKLIRNLYLGLYSLYSTYPRRFKSFQATNLGTSELENLTSFQPPNFYNSKLQDIRSCKLHNFAN